MKVGLGTGTSYITSWREILNVGFGELIFPGAVKRILSLTVPGENFFNPSYFQMRKFFIHSRIVQAA